MKILQAGEIDRTIARGIYVLLIPVPATEIAVGALGVIEFDPGLYLYVGSAQRGLGARILRHLGPKTKIHWHIDYLTCQHPPDEVVIFPERPRSFETELALVLTAALPAIPGFGSSDDNSGSHLVRAESRSQALELLEDQSAE